MTILYLVALSIHCRLRDGAGDDDSLFLSSVDADDDRLFFRLHP